MSLRLFRVHSRMMILILVLNVLEIFFIIPDAETNISKVVYSTVQLV